MDDKNKVYVKINGQEYPIVGYESKDYLIKVGTFVDDTMGYISKTNKHLSTAMIAVLASINIADQFLKLHSELEDLEKNQTPKEEVDNLKDECRKLIGELEQKDEAYNSLQNQVEELLVYKENVETEGYELREIIRAKDEELEKADEIINELRNKLLDNQMKLVEAQNKLEDLINRNEKKNHSKNKRDNSL